MCNRHYTDTAIKELHAIGDTPAIAYERGRQDALHLALSMLQGEKDRFKRQCEAGSMGGIYLAGLIVAIRIVQDVAQAGCDNPPTE